CRVLIHLVDISNEDPAGAMKTVNEELAAYGAGLADKPCLIALNKVDLADEELVAGFAQELLDAGADEVFAISGATGMGIEHLLDKVLGYLPDQTATETNAVEVEDEHGEDHEWSPI
ncbi:MAG: EutP/PduV family microcompartment system protein, partial [Marinomonas sp.]